MPERPTWADQDDIARMEGESGLDPEVARHYQLRRKAMTTPAPENFSKPAKAEKPAAKPAARPAPEATDRDRENAEVGALRARVAQLEEERSQERRTSNPADTEHYSAELAMEELWPGSVRDRA